MMFKKTFLFPETKKLEHYVEDFLLPDDLVRLYLERDDLVLNKM